MPATNMHTQMKLGTMTNKLTGNFSICKVSMQELVIHPIVVLQLIVSGDS